MAENQAYDDIFKRTIRERAAQGLTMIVEDRSVLRSLALILDTAQRGQR
jgi:hypothetical protein